ncbi:hypothetical protein [Novosphingobium sp. NBM11]|uniref:hypothetical protein n=1 Tax=Novosphingobium sp. NBM11 TaxID=2596914 RepID=UPI0021028970|nr:hypothetical protein [Novosphingobium sp. NBM11]
MKDELRAAGEHNAGDEEQDGTPIRCRISFTGAERESGDGPYRILAGDAGEVADRAAELAQPLHRQIPLGIVTP